jgi:hypothetical protein
MQKETLEVIQPTPTLLTKRCRFLVHVIAYALKLTPFIVFLITSYMYDVFIGFITTAFAYIINGIIRSKLRTASIPHTQLEYNYTDHAIASWYISNHLCYENREI